MKTQAEIKLEIKSSRCETKQSLPNRLKGKEDRISDLEKIVKGNR